MQMFEKLYYLNIRCLEQLELLIKLGFFIKFIRCNKYTTFVYKQFKSQGWSRHVLAVDTGQFFRALRQVMGAVAALAVVAVVKFEACIYIYMRVCMYHHQPP